MVKEFESGAVRSSDAEKVALYLISPICMRRMASFVTTCDISHEYKNSIRYVEQSVEAIYDFLNGGRDNCLEFALYNVMCAIHIEKGKTLPTIPEKSNGYSLIPIEGIYALARAYREGEHKYSPYNCELGMPVYDLLNHAILHLFKYLEGNNEEDQLGHAAWGLCMSMHSEELFIDLNKGTLRGPNCSLTDDIKEKIKETIAKRKLQ